jgi:hypothetical protein
MGEYGRIVGGGGGMGGGSGDLTGQVMSTLSGLVDKIASQPPEILLGALAIIVLGGWLFMRR